MDKNKEVLAALLRLSESAWRAYEEHNHDPHLFAAWDCIETQARAYGKDFYKDPTWDLGLAADQLLETLWT